MKSNKLFIALGIIAFSSVLFLTYFFTKNMAEKQQEITLHSQLQQVVNELTITLERHSYLPALLSLNPDVIQFLNASNQSSSDTDFSTLQSSLNLSLELINNISESSVIYLMNKKGDTIASSNWESAHSFIGKNFSYRPYFQQATQNILGRYYAVGAISGERGYFFASAVSVDHQVIGVIAVKVAIEDIEFTWGEGSLDFLVTDPDGVIFLSSQKDWLLKSLLPLSEAQKNKLYRNRRYGRKAIVYLGDTSLTLSKNDFQSVLLDGKQYKMLTHKMALADWDIRLIASDSRIKKTLVFNLMITTIILMLLSALAILLWKTQRQRKQYEQHTREELEKTVLKRTQALKQSQEDLIQAAKMAALGQLSASITHEINNPLTAIRAYADNAKQFLAQNKLTIVASNLQEISSLTESMATITRQLKSFSRKSRGQLKPVLIGHAVNNALSIVRPKLLSNHIQLHWDEKAQGQHHSVLADGNMVGTNYCQFTHQCDICHTGQSGEKNLDHDKNHQRRNALPDCHR